MLPTASPSNPAPERASGPACAGVSVVGAARTVSVMELETGCRLLLLLHRGGAQGRAYTLFAPVSHEFCKANALTAAIASADAGGSDLPKPSVVYGGDVAQGRRPPPRA